MGRRRRKPAGDPVDGILLLDKPEGITSNDALQQARKLLGAQKAGHTGSLDPIATGLLPLCFGTATRWSGYFLGSDKYYRATVRLGESTETGDSEGTIIETRNVLVSDEQLQNALSQFRGTYLQVPPMYSAIKVDGQPLYKLARQGKEIERQAREVTVDTLDLGGFNGRDVELTIHCSSGFYVRALATDLGELLQTGGHVTALRRLGVADLSVEDSVTLDDLAKMADYPDRRACLGAVDDALEHLPAVELSVDAAFYLCRGQSVRANNLPAEGSVRLYSSSTGFLGVGVVAAHGTVAPERLVSSGIQTA
ncbi:MAG TPA: tRNA pseudouridine(55) synthase TruB [Gammaproteobacteria bacterium]|jgi:tRNA pseudouridine55 synthase|nr:tRNA pseudouridine(55) synthase TruB [Acidiferrobacteraceae bacterium]MDP6552435.1 tRNA pseudouridine(55) synthase TruB [Arenicellales bacterium]MDP6790277.1 tRNA pseudouridine(55) synthase TruB [Arenicellales bacterium]MDP6918249.1 tRNA pseudouridine(55) synthase TruB [Arenicellales bacterium]HCX88069.1 tRNA pseudouridine(55) synthase TruB [Gammaproteobacteria bacterium]|tara:strand:- start:506 stop:1432 length:927 start_codon:yes stop_codon:yes gene_type:complete